jgi:hypothetical protein
MQLKEYLTKTDYFDGELYTASGVDSEFSFVWDEGYDFTEEGKKAFAQILESEILIDANKNIMLMDESITSDLLTEFLALCAGHVPQSYYDKHIVEVQNE